MGKEAVARLLRLPSSLLGYSDSGAATLVPSLMFARKYSSSSRPWIGFHHDEAECAPLVITPTMGLGLHRLADGMHTELQRLAHGMGWDAH